MIDSANLLAVIDDCIAVSSAAGTLISFKSDINKVWDERLGMSFVIRIAKNLEAKEESDRKQKVAPRFPFLPPFETGLFVCDLDENHRVLLNKFNVVDRHILIVSTEFMPQNSTMTAATLKQVMRCVEAMNGLAFHNHGEGSGASQPHFHIQVIPRYESEHVPDAPLTALVRGYDCLFDSASSIDRFPIRHLVIRFRPGQFNVKSVERHYLSMLSQLGLTTESSYNFLLTAEYMMIVPRRISVHQGIGVNTLAYSGNMFFRDEQQFRTLMDEIGGPGQLLLHLGYPIVENDPATFRDC